MKLLPVLDLLQGIVVRGVAGKRDEYRPVESCLTVKADALSVANAFRESLDLSELYVADLDAILHDQPNADIFRRLAADGFPFMVDAGLRDVDRARMLIDTGATAVIAGLETTPGPNHLRQLCRDIGTDRVIFSLDLQAGRPLGDLSQWECVRVGDTTDPFEIASEAIGAGIERMIVLDLEQVGVGQGVSTADLCRRLSDRFPALRLITGGGVRTIRDVLELATTGAEAVLVASALHNGVIGDEELSALNRV